MNFLDHPVVTREEWNAQRNELLTKEKELTRQRDALTKKLRELPWVKVEEAYVFDTVRGKESLKDQFEDKSQLIVYHFMFAPDWEAGCKNCSFWGDHYDSLTHHLLQRDVSFKVISRAPLEKLQNYETRMGWKFDWISSFPSTFNLDFGVTKGDSESPGFSIFARRGEDVFHTYFTTGRGLEVLNTTYGALDLVPKGRNEDGLEYPMAWVKRHDEY
jgi:predicted dithiol-disulfide oxidoreductase (DUF899 family)